MKNVEIIEKADSMEKCSRLCKRCMSWKKLRLWKDTV
jgi:hypothetical protein